MKRIIVLLLLLGAAPVYGQFSIEGGCLIGARAMNGNKPPAEPIDAIKQYTSRYRKNYKAIKQEERRVRSVIAGLWELDVWTQKEVVQFTEQQRKLLYISVAGQLANGQISDSELPAYAASINERITELEVQLGCKLLPAS